MCYYALSIFAGCGHAVRAAKPVEGLSGCPYRQKEMSNRQFMTTPSLTSSISTEASPRTTIGSIESLPALKEQNGISETTCVAKLWHPLHIHRFQGLCDHCETQALKRLSDLDFAIAEGQASLIQKARRDKVRIEGRKPRRLELVHRQDVARAEKAEKDTEAVKGESQRPSSSNSFKDSASSSTFSYMRGLWAAPKATKAPQSPRGSEHKSFAEADDGSKKLEIGPLNIAPEDPTHIAGQDEQGGGT